MISRGFSDKEKDKILYAHLIPCCQNYLAHAELTEGETAQIKLFEQTMNERSAKFVNKNRDELEHFLRQHPINRGNPVVHKKSAFGNICSAQKKLDILRKHKDTNVINPQFQFTWEYLLSLLRNIFCHECSSRWENLMETSKKMLEYFPSRSDISDMILLYYEIVVLPRLEKFGLKIAGFENIKSQRLVPVDGEDVHPEIWDKILIFVDLIPARVCNSIVSINFEHEMEIRSEAFASWEPLGLYLKSHPANFENHADSLEEISWIVMIRMMRNVFCHSKYLDWRCLAELERYIVNFFGNLTNFEEFLVLYFKFTNAKLISNYEQEKLFNEQLINEERNIKRKRKKHSENENSFEKIQLKNPHNFFTDKKNEIFLIKKNQFFQRLFQVDFLAENQRKNFTNKIHFLVAHKNAGKSLILNDLMREFISRYKKRVTYQKIIFEAENIRNFNDLYFQILNKITKNQVKEIENISIQEIFAKILSVQPTDNFLIIFDNFHELMAKFTEKVIFEFILNVEKMLGQHKKFKIIFSCSPIFLHYFLLSNPSFVQVGNYNILNIHDYFNSQQLKEIKDTELLCRHFYSIDKWKLKQVLFLLPEFLFSSVNLILLAKSLIEKYNPLDYLCFNILNLFLFENYKFISNELMRYSASYQDNLKSALVTNSFSFCDHKNLEKLFFSNSLLRMILLSPLDDPVKYFNSFNELKDDIAGSFSISEWIFISSCFVEHRKENYELDETTKSFLYYLHTIDPVNFPLVLTERWIDSLRGGFTYYFTTPNQREKVAEIVNCIYSKFGDFRNFERHILAFC